MLSCSTICWRSTDRRQTTYAICYGRHRCFSRSNVAREKFRGCQGEPLRGERRKRRILCEASAAYAAERFPALPASQGHTDLHRHCANPPAAVRTDEQLNPYAVPGGADFLAHHHLWKLRPVCQTQRNRFRLAVRFCTVGRWGDLPSPGAGSAICGFDANFQRATAQRPHAARSLSPSHDRGCRPEQAPTTIAVVATCCSGFSIDQVAR